MNSNTVKLLTVFLTLVLIAIFVFKAFVGVNKQAHASALFKRITVDAHGPIDPWGKALGDINDDGKLEILVGGNHSQELVYYLNPDWDKITVDAGKPFSTDHAIVDIDKDNKNDILALTKKAILWYKNPDWQSTLIDNVTLHDVEVADFDNDGDWDIVARDQSAFGGAGDQLYFYEQISPSNWQRTQHKIPAGEGLKVADMNKDARQDVIVNGVWYENSGTLSNRPWRQHVYAKDWIWDHAFIDVGDINNDGNPDVVLSPAERKGDVYRLSWFSAPANKQSEWQEHVVVEKIKTVHHFVGISDVNKDGQLDILTAAMHQGDDPDEVSVFLNLGNGKRWQQRVLSTQGSHSMKIADIDNDGDDDLMGANWSGDYQPIELWLNNTCPPEVAWRRHVIDKTRPWKAIFVDSADINQDGLQDIVSGGWWYENPGLRQDDWQRKNIAYGANNMAFVFDVDADGDPDILATQGKGAEHNGNLVWAINDGHGNFSVQDGVLSSKGDFLQGATTIKLADSGKTAVALSWHQKDNGVQLLSPGGESPEWQLQTISQFSQDEALSTGDIDNDGDMDLLLGTRWLKNSAGQWQVESISDRPDKPDRNALVDMNNDGKLDVVVGFEAISVAGDVVWFEQLASGQQWREHKVATLVGPMSLDVADMDGDKDLDIVVGEHNLKQAQKARLLILENVNGEATQWREQVVSIGDEHHDGAQVVDIDNDGDNDIISIGWGHNNVLLYENKIANCQ